MFRLENVSFRWLSWAAVVFAVILVAVFTVLRWEGRRTAQDAYVPLRPVTAQEAVVLLSSNYAGIVRLDADAVVVGAFRYLTPEGGDSAVSWESYYITHHLPRKDLEAAMGRALQPADADVSRFEKFRVSYSSHHIWAFALFEVCFITLWLIGLLATLRCVKRYLLFIPILTLFLLIICVVVPFYSPALVDADWFYQRIVLEEIWFLSLAGLVFTLPASILCLCLQGLSSMGCLLKRKMRIRARTFWLSVAGLFVLLAGIWMVFGYCDYVQERDAGLCVLNQVADDLTPETIALLTKDLSWKESAQGLYSVGETRFEMDALSEPVVRAIDSILKPEYFADRYVIRVLLPLERDVFFFLWQNPTFRYMDVRFLAHGNCALGDYGVVERMLRDRAGYIASFTGRLRAKLWGYYYGREFIAGTLTTNDFGKVTALVLLGRDETPR